MACAAVKFDKIHASVQSPDKLAIQITTTTTSTTTTVNSTAIHGGIKKRSRASKDRLLATAAAMLKVLGISSSTRGNKSRQTKSKISANMLKSTDKNTPTMPAMSKDKSCTVAENNYSELKLKETKIADKRVEMCSNDQTTSPSTNSTNNTAHTDHHKIGTKTECCSKNSSTINLANNYQTTTATTSTTTKQISNTVPTTSTATTTTMPTQNGETTAGNGHAYQNNHSSNPAKRSAIDFRFGKAIGEGSFSTVYLAKDIHTNKEYAIKVCEKQLIIREKKQEYIKREREVMHVLSGVPGFVNLYCTFQDYKSLYFVMTYAKNGDLLPSIQKVGSFDQKSTQFYAAELVLSLENMHKRGIIHRDLKPENILFDEKWHTLIADFGSAKILKQSTDGSSNTVPSDNENDIENENDALNVNRKRTNSFVGTAQYVSPEILTGHRTTKTSDLWALGCIIYQMISGLPPFRAGTEYLIFQKILKLELCFPDGFEKIAKDLVEKLLQLEPNQRLGADDSGDRYDSIRSHPFFDGIEWDTIRTQTPPPIHPYLPSVSDDDDDDDDELLNQYNVPDHLEPGLDDRQLTRLLGIELGTSVSPQLSKQPKNILNITDLERKQRIDVQKEDKWHKFVDSEVILKQGFVNKRKGLFARKRMLLLTTGPRLVYVDPVTMVKKGEIPWSQDLRCEPKNFKIFFVHTPHRTYYLEDPQGYALEWCQTIEDVRQKTFET